MTATLEGQQVKEKHESAPYSAGLLLCQLLEAIEVLEDHMQLGGDAELAVAVLADHAKLIRKQALEEGLLRPLEGDDGTCGCLSIGEALMDADSASYKASHPEAIS